MMTPNRIKIIFDGGIAEVYGDIFSDIITCYYNTLYDRQTETKNRLANISLDDENRVSEFKSIAQEYDDTESRMKIIDKIEKVFHNRSGNPIHYIQNEKSS